MILFFRRIIDGKTYYKGADGRAAKLYNEA